MDAATFRRLGHEMVEWVAAYREGIERSGGARPPGWLGSRGPFRDGFQSRCHPVPVEPMAGE